MSRFTVTTIVALAAAVALIAFALSPVPAQADGCRIANCEICNPTYITVCDQCMNGFTITNESQTCTAAMSTTTTTQTPIMPTTSTTEAPTTSTTTVTPTPTTSSTSTTQTPTTSTTTTTQTPTISTTSTTPIPPTSTTTTITTTTSTAAPVVCRVANCAVCVVNSGNRCQKCYSPHIMNSDGNACQLGTTTPNSAAGSASALCVAALGVVLLSALISAL